MTDIEELVRRLDAIQAAVTILVERQQVREFYSVEEFAAVVGRAEFTVREWCRLGRIHGTKKQNGRGRTFEWVISNEELLRFRKDGLLPLRAG
jgi:hypothetical protein